MIYYPVSYCIYAAGVSAVASENWPALAVLLTDLKYRKDPEGEQILMVSRINLAYMFWREDAMMFEQPITNAKFPASEYLMRRLMKSLSGLVADRNFELNFDRWEFLLSQTQFIREDDTLPGRFVYQLGERYMRGRNSPIVQQLADGILLGQSWEPFSLGLFGGAPDIAEQKLSEHLDAITILNSRMMFR